MSRLPKFSATSAASAPVDFRPTPEASSSSSASSPTNFLEAVDKLKFFLATAPSTFPASDSQAAESPGEDERALNRFLLPTGELISCVLWNGLYHVTGTDIVRALNFRFMAFGRPVRNTKKFEEGVFSDLRNLKSGTDATLEEPKSEFLELLFKHNCIRTQKKQKVFYWFSVPHDRLFLDALDRDLKREKLGQESTTEAVHEPALSFRWNPNKTLFEQFTTAHTSESSTPSRESARVVDTLQCPSDEVSILAPDSKKRLYGSEERQSTTLLPSPSPDVQSVSSQGGLPPSESPPSRPDTQSRPIASPENSGDTEPRTFANPQVANSIFGAFALFEGSPSYKQRRRPSERSRGGQTSAELPLPCTFDTFNLSSSSSLHSVAAAGSAPSIPRGFDGYDTEEDEGQAPSDHLSAMQQTDYSTNYIPSHYLSAQPLPSSRHYFHPLHAPHPLPGLQSPRSHSHGSNPRWGSHLEDDSFGYHPSTPAGSATDVAGEINPVKVQAPALSPALVNASGSPLSSSSGYTFSQDTTGTSRTYVCPLFSCGRLFKRLEHLKRHVRTHTSEKPYVCSTCSKAFARSDNLAAHMKIHRGSAACTSFGDSERSQASDEDGEEELSSITDVLEEQEFNESRVPGQMGGELTGDARTPLHSDPNLDTPHGASYAWYPPYHSYPSPVDHDREDSFGGAVHLDRQSDPAVSPPATAFLAASPYVAPSPFRRYRSATPTIGTSSDRRNRALSVDRPVFSRHSMAPAFPIGPTPDALSEDPVGPNPFPLGSFRSHISAVNNLSHSIDRDNATAQYSTHWSPYNLAGGGDDTLSRDSFEAGTTFYDATKDYADTSSQGGP